MKKKKQDMKCLVQYGDVLKEDINSRLYKYAVAKKKSFRKYDTPGKPTVLFAEDFADFVPYFEKFTRKHFTEVCQCLNIKPFKFHGIKLYISSYNHGEHYELHPDKGDKETEDKMITFVYYFYSPVKRFSGGELLFPENGKIRVEPVNNTIVFFNPTLLHEVLPVSCNGKEFKNGRFSVNGWILKEPLFI